MKRDQVVEKLSILIEKRNVHNEIECGKILRNHEAASVLLPRGASMVLVDTELRTSSGDVDLIVCADESIAGEQTRRRLYVWELKAPQLPLFCVKTKGRACPTDDFYSAENQLIHYHASLAGSTEDRRILRADDVLIGGIIIGSSRTFVTEHRSVCKAKAIRLAAKALDIRERTLYRPINLRVLTWNMVIDSLKDVTASHMLRRPRKKVSIPLDVGPEFDEEIVQAN
jgi:hypothetical protein